MKLSGINIDEKSKFNEHVLEICSKAGRKLSYLECQNQFHLENEEPYLKHSLDESQFKYYPLLWMFHNHSTKIDSINHMNGSPAHSL